MQEISQEYIILFKAITEAERELRRLREQLVLAQQLAEESFLSRPELAE